MGSSCSTLSSVFGCICGDCSCCCAGKDFEAKSAKYLPNCLHIAEDFFKEDHPSEQESITFFASLQLACKSLLDCSDNNAREFMIRAVNRDTTLSLALDKYLAKKDRAFPNVTRSVAMENWMKYDEDNSGDLSYKEIKKLCLGMNFPEPLADKILSYFKDSDRSVRYPTFEKAYIRSTSFKELGFVFDEVTSNGDKMTRAVFSDFVRQTQRETVDDQGIEDRMLALGSVDADSLTKTQFIDYISRLEFSSLIRVDKMSKVYQDMTRPICEYFINSSHNTYLTGDQLSSKSSTDMYKKALLDGCRCLELDCWNGSRNEPVVYHGHTRTSKIKFADCIEVIKENAFIKSQYPVILSLEIHTNMTQQDRMAEVMEEIFGDLLFRPPWGPNGKPTFDFSPENLKHKILLKSKRGNYPYEEGMDKDEDDDEDTEGNEDYAKAKEERKKEEKQDTSERLSAIISIESAGYKGLEDMSYLSDRHPYHCTSFSEGKGKKAYTENMEAFIKLNNACLSRIYPAGTRFDSSNYDPQPFWNAGCQIVALNWQSVKTFEWRFNRSFFYDNGKCGYMLKPQSLRNMSMVAEKRTFTLEIISAFCLPKPQDDKKDAIDPCVSVFLQGPDLESTPRRTKAITNNGFHPVWRGLGDNEFSWLVPNWEMSSLVVQIFDKDKVSSDGLVGENIMPLRLVSRGYRRVNLQDVSGNYIPGACLMVKVSYI